MERRWRLDWFKSDWLHHISGIRNMHMSVWIGYVILTGPLLSHPTMTPVKFSTWTFAVGFLHWLPR